MIAEHKIRIEGNYVRERLLAPADLKQLGYSFRTKVARRHRIILAFPPGRRRRGRGIVQAILHPLSEARDGTFLCRGTSCRRVDS